MPDVLRWDSALMMKSRPGQITDICVGVKRMGIASLNGSALNFSTRFYGAASMVGCDALHSKDEVCTDKAH